MLPHYHYIGFYVLTAVITKSQIFWNVTTRSLLKVNRFFVGKYLHLQGRRISQTRNQHELGSKQLTVLH
jgi:hypothetical protein